MYLLSAFLTTTLLAKLAYTQTLTFVANGNDDNCWVQIDNYLGCTGLSDSSIGVFDSNNNCVGVDEPQTLTPGICGNAFLSISWNDGSGYIDFQNVGNPAQTLDITTWEINQPNAITVTNFWPSSNDGSMPAVTATAV